MNGLGQGSFFFRWLREDKTHTPEGLVSILEYDTHRLLVAREYLQ